MEDDFPQDYANRVIIEVPNFTAPAQCERAGRRRAADGERGVRVLAGTPFYPDDDHITEFTGESLAATLTAAGWSVTSLEQRNGMLLAVADSRAGRKSWSFEQPASDRTP
jgi:hypothetical protein